MRAWVTILGTVALIAPVSHANAQGVCEEGRVATIAGYCCWPAQTWSADLGRCDGPPLCPVGRTPSGADCVLESPIGVAVDGAQPAADPATTQGESDPFDAQAAAEPARRHHVGLIVSGSIFLGSGYLASIVTGVWDLATEQPSLFIAPGSGPPPARIHADTGCRDQVGAWLFVPVVGSLAAAITAGVCRYPAYDADPSTGAVFTTSGGPPMANATSYVVVGIATSVFELLGFGLLLGGVLAPTTAEGMGSIDIGDARLTLAAHANGADLGGLSMRLAL